MSALSAEYTGTAEQHWFEVHRLVAGLGNSKYGVHDANQMLQLNAARAVYHTSLARKYERAASYPWLAVEPDPPEPWWQLPQPESPVNLDRIGQSTVIVPAR
jgi:hypothetical protein